MTGLSLKFYHSIKPKIRLFSNFCILSYRLDQPFFEFAFQVMFFLSRRRRFYLFLFCVKSIIYYVSKVSLGDDTCTPLYYLIRLCILGKLPPYFLLSAIALPT